MNSQDKDAKHNLDAPADPAEATEQRDALLESQRKANRQQPRNFKEDALTDKEVHVEPDGTGPSPMGSLDAPEEAEQKPAPNAPE